MQIFIGGIDAAGVRSTQTVCLRLRHIPDRQGFRGLSRRRTRNAFFCGNVCFVWRNGFTVHSGIPICQHPVKNQLDRFGRHHVFLPLVVDDPLRSVNNLISGKPGFVHRFPQKSGRLSALIDFVALHPTFITAGHRELERKIGVGNQGFCCLLHVGLQLWVIVLKRIDAAVSHRLLIPLVNVLGRVHLVQISASTPMSPRSASASNCWLLACVWSTRLPFNRMSSRVPVCAVSSTV